MKHVIAGTAGHIDHGKTALVRALTGIDADRLEEEKRRGITIDLGFAHLQLTPDIRLGFVDVPGHERFVRNMLAGAGGFDLLLFVVAADESIKPQTREHFEICRLLEIPRGIVVLTKSDLVDPDTLQLVRLEIEELVSGSFLQAAPVVPVSSVTGAGLDHLRAELARVAATVPEKDARGHFRLPIDRVFTLRGFGTVVTGTLVSGAISKEDEVELHPAGRRLRVRGIQVHGEQCSRAIAGQRTALNLPDIEPAELARGNVLTAPGLFHAVERFDCRLELLRSAKPLKHRAPVHFHSGTGEIEAEVRLFSAASSLRPGESAYARIVLREPALLLPFDRFIIRQFSPVATIGGGSIIDITGHRYRSDEDPAERLADLASADPARRIARLVREAPFGLSAAELIAATGIAAETIGTARRTDPEWFAATRDQLVRRVRAFHRDNPLLPGIPRQDLRGPELAACPAPLFDALIDAAPDLTADGDIVRLSTHRLTLKDDESEARARIENAFRQAGLAVPTLPDVLSQSGVEPARARRLVEILLREKSLVRVSPDLLFHSSAIERLRALLAAHRGERISVPTFKEWTGVSRKYAIPLLEFCDRERLTRREADQRLVL